jgi:hypothetical protein
MWYIWQSQIPNLEFYYTKYSFQAQNRQKETFLKIGGRKNKITNIFIITLLLRFLKIPSSNSCQFYNGQPSKFTASNFKICKNCFASTLTVIIFQMVNIQRLNFFMVVLMVVSFKILRLKVEKNSKLCDHISITTMWSKIAVFYLKHALGIYGLIHKTIWKRIHKFYKMSNIYQKS